MSHTGIQRGLNDNSSCNGQLFVTSSKVPGAATRTSLGSFPQTSFPLSLELRPLTSPSLVAPYPIFPPVARGKRGFSDNFLFFLFPPIPSWPLPASPATLASAWETRKGTPPLLNPFVSLPPSPSFCNAHSCLSPLLFSFRPAAADDDDDEGDSAMMLHSFFSLPSHARQQKEQDSRERERETVREASTHPTHPKKSDGPPSPQNARRRRALGNTRK